MKSAKSYNKWITAGYELFAQEGPEGIQIERLARILDLNKSGFYYYFGNLETYFEHLMHHHLQQAAALVEKVKTIPNFAPEYIHLMSEYTVPVLAHRQLMRSRHIALFSKTYAQVYQMISPAIIPLWAKFIGLSHNTTLASRYLEMVRDVFFSRVTNDTMSFEFITDIAMDAKELCDELRNSVQTTDIEKQPA
jgi:AcrR family transcriptional regulator